ARAGRVVEPVDPVEIGGMRRIGIDACKTVADGAWGLLGLGQLLEGRQAHAGFLEMAGRAPAHRPVGDLGGELEWMDQAALPDSGASVSIVLLLVSLSLVARRRSSRIRRGICRRLAIRTRREIGHRVVIQGGTPARGA